MSPPDLFYKSKRCIIGVLVILGFLYLEILWYLILGILSLPLIISYYAGKKKRLKLSKNDRIS